MKLPCALVNEPDCTYMVVIVNQAIVDDRDKAEQTIRFLQTRNASVPTVLMARGGGGTPGSYYGRADIALRLVCTPASALRWQELSIG